jgi:hypothetical protein
MGTIAISSADVKKRVSAKMDEYARDWLPAQSFARYVYDNKPAWEIRRGHSPAQSDKAECEKWGLSPEEWADQYLAARIALQHDLKLDLISSGHFGA